jgi:hypothetical protein
MRITHFLKSEFYFPRAMKRKKKTELGHLYSNRINLIFCNISLISIIQINVRSSAHSKSDEIVHFTWEVGVAFYTVHIFIEESEFLLPSPSKEIPSAFLLLSLSPSC